MKFLTFAALAGLAAAACPNQCSGHGSCSDNDICTCFPGFTAADCSERKCEVDRAWATNSANPHAYAECSGQGVCNRQTGECECFDGFEGRACARSSCPNDCSGHGQCKLLSEVKTAVAYDASNWDAKRIQTCVCDPGFTSSDCSERLCPTGDDPLTLCKSGVKKQVQEVRFALGSSSTYDIVGAAAAANIEDDDLALFGYDADKDHSNAEGLKGQLRISYVDSWGGKWTASGVDAFPSGANDAARNTNAQNAIKYALENLPNKKVHDVSVASKPQWVESVYVDRTSGSPVLTKATPWVTDANNRRKKIPMRAWTVTFNGDATNSNNVGLQNSLICDSGYSCTESGCQPIIKMPFLYRYASTDAMTIGTDVNNLAAVDSVVNFYRGSDTVAAVNGVGAFPDTNTNFQAKKFIRLAASSQPQLPKGYDVDSAAVNPSTTSDHNDVFKRYDIRVLIAVVDGSLADGNDASEDLYYTKVVLGHQNIAKTNSEAVGFDGNGKPAKVWTHQLGEDKWAFTLDGFTFQGVIPPLTDASGATVDVPIPGAPGVKVNFPSRNMVAANEGRVFEIVVKLPSCSVTPVTEAQQVFDIDRAAAIAPVDSEVENIECSGRGACDRKTGKCACYEGYQGIGCNRNSVLV